MGNTMKSETHKDDLAEKYRGTGVGGRMADVLAKGGVSTNTFSINGQQPFLSGEPGGPTQHTIAQRGLPAFDTNPSIDNMTEVIEALNDIATATGENGFFAETYSWKLLDSLKKYRSLKKALDNITSFSEFPNSNIAEQLQIVTQIMKTASARGVDRDIFYVSHRGYDTHKNIEDRLRMNFIDLDAALKALVEDLKGSDLWESTVLLQFSEFGRTIAPNSGDGTDHGWAGNHFMFGGSVNGGQVLGKYPSDFEQSSRNKIVLRRGRIIPTYPWDAMWKGAAEWFGVTASDMKKVLPMHENFPPDLLYGRDDLFTAA